MSDEYDGLDLMAVVRYHGAAEVLHAVRAVALEIYGNDDRADDGVQRCLLAVAAEQRAVTT